MHITGSGNTAYVTTAVDTVLLTLHMTMKINARNNDQQNVIGWMGCNIWYFDKSTELLRNDSLSSETKYLSTKVLQYICST